MPRSKKPEVAMNIIVFYGLLGSLAALLCAFWPRWITIVFRSDDLVPAIPILGIAILLWLVSSAFDGFMLVNGDSRLVSVVYVIIQFIKTILFIGASLLFGNIRAIVLAAVLQGALQCT